LQSRQWEDNEGAKHYATEIVANEMIMLGDRRENNASPEYEGGEEMEYPY
jgi:single-strand DNA-binding protein